MGAALNLEGQKFGKLTVLEKTNERKQKSIVWKCQCDCYGEKSIVYVAANQLTSGRVRSCGCLTHQSKYYDLTGMTFGRWNVLYPVGKDEKSRAMKWHCKCMCKDHTEKDLLSYQLIQGISTSCGCKQKEMASLAGRKGARDLTGMQFGKLIVKERIYHEDNKLPRWLCECTCDNRTNIICTSRDLLRGHKLSCGCINKSYGEYVIENILNENNIEFVRNFHFVDCKFPDTHYFAYFDFYVNNSYIIEFDGLQHFEPHCFFNGTSEDALIAFRKTREHDLYKTRYCLINNIPIIRIPYTHVNNIVINDLQKETSIFLIEDGESKEKMSIYRYFEIPATCPTCGGAAQVIKDNQSEVLMCANPNCSGKLLGRLKHFVSKKGMDIDGLSEATLSKFIDLGWLNNFTDIYRLPVHYKQIINLDGFGRKSADNLLEAMGNSRQNVKLENFITALSIPGIGEGQTKVICKKYPTWYEFCRAVEEDDLTQIDGIGEVLNRNIKTWFADPENIEQAFTLASIMEFAKPEFMNKPTLTSRIAGLTFVVTGSVEHFKNRDELKTKIESLGGKCTGSVTKKTDYLINNDVTSTSGKNQKAKDLGVPIISEADFLKMIGE